MEPLKGKDMAFTLQDLFDLLTTGELAHLHIGGSKAGIIDQADHRKIIPAVNLGLSAIYRRFPIKEKRVSFSLVPGSYKYTLYQDDLNKIARVFTDTGQELVLNNEGDKYSCFTPSFKVLVVPSDIVDNVTSLPSVFRTTGLELVYRANHPKLLERDPILDPEQIELEIPYTHVEALLYFIAARMHAPTGSGQFEGLIGNNYTAKYEAAVQQLSTIVPQEEVTANQTRFSQKGFA